MYCAPSCVNRHQQERCEACPRLSSSVYSYGRSVAVGLRCSCCSNRIWYSWTDNAGTGSPSLASHEAYCNLHLYLHLSSRQYSSGIAVPLLQIPNPQTLAAILDYGPTEDLRIGSWPVNTWLPSSVTAARAHFALTIAPPLTMLTILSLNVLFCPSRGNLTSPRGHCLHATPADTNVSLYRTELQEFTWQLIASLQTYLRAGSSWSLDPGRSVDSYGTKDQGHECFSSFFTERSKKVGYKQFSKLLE